jgi:hypothetical protein
MERGRQWGARPGGHQHGVSCVAALPLRGGEGQTICDTCVQRFGAARMFAPFATWSHDGKRIYIPLRYAVSGSCSPRSRTRCQEPYSPSDSGSCCPCSRKFSQIRQPQQDVRHIRCCGGVHGMALLDRLCHARWCRMSAPRSFLSCANPKWVCTAEMTEDERLTCGRTARK